MSPFPNEFAKPPEILQPDLGRLGNEALERLNRRGYDVAIGLDEYYAGAISVMAQQSHIIEYCPKDATADRFGSRNSTEEWLRKGGGRAVFLFLEKIEDAREELEHQLAGYAWTGYDSMAKFADYPITSAYRLGANALGKKLATDFIQTVVSGTHALFSQDGLGLETWCSNPAVRIYERLGFFALQAVADLQEERRPTLNSKASDSQITDLRLHMGYPQKLLV